MHYIDLEIGEGREIDATDVVSERHTIESMTLGIKFVQAVQIVQAVKRFKPMRSYWCHSERQ